MIDMSQYDRLHYLKKKLVSAPSASVTHQVALRSNHNVQYTHPSFRDLPRKQLEIPPTQFRAEVSASRNLTDDLTFL